MILQDWRKWDPLLFAANVALLLFGVGMVYSASQAILLDGAGILAQPAVRQLLYAVFGLGFGLLVAAIDFRILRHLAWHILVVVCLSLIAVRFIGDDSYGSRRWLELGFIQIQPSELAKIALALALARFYSDRAGDQRRLKTLLLSLLVLAMPVVLVLIQPDLGTVIVYCAIWAGVSYVAGIRLRHVGAVAGIALALSPLAYQFVLTDYQRERIQQFFSPTVDPLNRDYNLIQAEISVGSGGLFGKGWLAGTQSQGQFLRVQHTDFIFSVTAEELGLIGAIVLFGLFSILFMRMLRAAAVSPDAFGRLFIVGIVCWFMAQVFINIGVNIRLLPVTGVPLPFISYGGSSLLTICIAIGLVQGAIMRRERHRF